MTPSSAVSVLVVDDQRPFRLAARAVVRRAPGFVLAGEAESGEAGVAAAETLRPDLVLMDVNLPGIDGVAAGSRIRDFDPSTVVVLVSTYGETDLPAMVAQSGMDYLHKADLAPGVLRDLWERRAPGSAAH
ncbi:response regulator transcription factor [Frankia sp. CNm7]|uniref:Response regulator transcription factor n=1 Tax=Frankia nepalensis TaxID=1836974 RepID=A0A937RMB7_9ACTN|nr:response regulator transcription factor [Frankia nepalensis]MBL7500696.1 response regulator transcription factor [Frankia nepalensis]MBL7515693.1 response regulator transcription factor [Frankia nepalensis]MBL7517924.1 response regulator transcription factor [Frankia nepalensis]MBL7632752.1 response regulator transcription factor [Frankia nepalensis]